jgi:hypothetical protein
MEVKKFLVVVFIVTFGIQIKAQTTTPQKTTYRFPSPTEIMAFVKDQKIEYNAIITNYVKDVDKYTERKKQAIVLGIYLTDVAYDLMFEKNNDAHKCLKSIQKLCDRMRIALPISERTTNLLTQKNMIRDSIMLIADDAYNMIFMFCEQNNMLDVMSLIAMGSYVEFLYISMNYVGKYEDNNPLIHKIAENKYAFNNLSKYVKAFRKKLPETYMKDFMDIEAIYNELIPVETPTKKESTNNTVTIKGGTKFKFNEQLFTKLKDKVTVARSNYIAVK